MTFLLLLASVLSGLPGSPSGLAAPAPEPAKKWVPAGWTASPVFTAQAPAGTGTTPEAVQQRRSQFVGFIKRGLFERFDDSRQEVIFKRNDPSHSVHEPGPLEDEAIASAAREALAADYAKLGLKARLTCTSGKLSIGSLPDDPAAAAAIIDTVLALDGVQTVAATLPPSLRMP